MTKPLLLDGTHAGGQILRSALSLSLCTGIPFVLNNIRGLRPKSGLMRQHLVCVEAAARIGSAHTEGAALHSKNLVFTPQTLQGGEFHFSIGSAGSTTLVLQTVIPALLHADAPSRVVIQGGTHNPFAPTADFLQQSFLPALRQMGADIQLERRRVGFHPAGGGELVCVIQPWKTRHVRSLNQKTQLLKLEVCSMVAGLPYDVGAREILVLKKLWEDLDNAMFHVEHIQPRDTFSVGNALSAAITHGVLGGGEHTSVLTELGEKHLSAERVAQKLHKRLKALCDAPYLVENYLADQLLLPMSLLGKGEFSTDMPSDHFRSNAALIQQFLPVWIHATPSENEVWQIKIES